MPMRIDDESKAARVVLVRRHKEAAFLGARAPSAAWRGDDLDKARLLIRRDRGHNDPVVGVLLLESAPILFPGFTGLEHGAEDRFPRAGPAILDRSLGASPLERGEEMRKGDRDDRPRCVFLIPAAPRAKHGMDSCVTLGRQMPSNGRRRPPHKWSRLATGPTAYSPWSVSRGGRAL